MRGGLEDLKPALTALAFQSPLAKLISGMSAAEIQRLERQVADFLRIDEIGKAVAFARDALLATPVRVGDPLEALHRDVNALIAPISGKRVMLAGFA